MPHIAIIVPARLGSTRFPRKLLHPVKGQPLILWTAQRIQAVAPQFPLFFAVAEQELADVLEAHGFESLMTDPELPTGTDRLAAANANIDADYVINVQADEPLVTAQQINTLAELITSGSCDMATLGVPFQNVEDFRDPNRVKAIRRFDGRALYFSRSPIPFHRDAHGELPQGWLEQGRVLLHLGLYAYTKAFLKRFSSLPQGHLEQVEKLEQLRALENGYEIALGVTDQPTVGVDAPSDVAILENRLNAE